jgi:hypothetical protein
MAHFVRVRLKKQEPLRNVDRIVIETGLRIYKKLTPMKKDLHRHDTFGHPRTVVHERQAGGPVKSLSVHPSKM